MKCSTITCDFAVGLLVSCLVPALLHAQVSVTVGGREVQIHGYLSEGAAASTDNNYLRMNTSQGSLFTEAGLNVSSQISDKFRVGAQVYDRYIGELGKGRVYLDWAFADYHLKDWIGFRAGKIKTPLGLYNDTQDQEFLHTWAVARPGGSRPTPRLPRHRQGPADRSRQR